MQRHLAPFIESDLAEKMVLLSGPRQCGKTTLAQEILSRRPGGVYLNWDDPDDRRRIRSRDWSELAPLIALDELHKYAKWRNWLKGTFDTQRDRHAFLVTGSARLDIYRRGGDSLVGRFHPWRLHPICMAETPRELDRAEAFRRLLELGGFPEPFLSGSPTSARRWRRVRRELILREDLRDLERVREISQISLLLDLLAARVGGAAVMSNLAEDLEVAPKTVRHWVDILERLYLVFSVSPYARSLPRSIKKAQKVYFFDTGELGEDPGRRFENLVATHLLKRLHFLEDSTGDRYELRYLQDKEGHEVDFLVLRNNKPSCLIEAKWSDPALHPPLLYYRERIKARTAVQLVGNGLKRPEQRQGVSILPAADWLSQPLGTDLFP